MYPNLRAEMARHEPILKTKDIASALGISLKSVNNKLSGRTAFTVIEVKKIRDAFFPHMQIDFLFEERRRLA